MKELIFKRKLQKSTIGQFRISIPPIIAELIGTEKIEIVARPEKNCVEMRPCFT